MREMWQALGDIYGVKFTSSFGVDPMGKAGSRWARVLGGFSREMIAHGIQACENHIGGWIDLPTFKARCLGIPEFHAVSLEIMEPRRQTSQFGRLVWLNMPGSASTYRNARPERQDMLLRQAYQLSCEHVMRGGKLPDVLAGDIEHKDWKRDPNHPRDLIKVAEEQKRVEELLGVNDSVPVRDRVTPVDEAENLKRVIAAMPDHILAVAMIARAGGFTATNSGRSRMLHFELNHTSVDLTVLQDDEGSLRFYSAEQRAAAESVYFELEQLSKGKKA